MRVEYLLFFALLISCDGERVRELQVAYQGSLAVPISSKIKGFTSCLKMGVDDKSFYYLNEIDNSLLKISLDNAKVTKQLTVARSGPNSILKMNGFSEISPGRLLVSSKGDYKIYDLDFEKDSVNTFLDFVDIPNSPLSYPVYFHSREMRDPIMLGDTLVLDNFLWGARDYQEANLGTHDIFTMIDMSSTSIIQRDIHMPGDFFDYGDYSYPRFSFDSDLSQRITFFSFVTYPGLFKIDWATGDMAQVKVDTRHIRYKTRHSAASDPITQSMVFGRNANLLLDKYRKLVYLIVKHDEDTVPEVETLGMDGLYTYNTFSVQVFDYDLNLLGSTVLDTGRKYIMNNMFVGPKGLYVSKNNPLHDEYNEDVLEFDIFQFE